MGTYTLDGIPSDLLNSGKEGVRRLKVESTIVDSEIDLNTTIKKEFTYNADGTIATKTETNLDNGMVTLFTYEWTDGNLTKITPQVIT